MFDLQDVVGRPLDMLRDFVAVSRAVPQRPENEHVQGSLKQFDAIARGFLHGWSTFYPDVPEGG